MVDRKATDTRSGSAALETSGALTQSRSSSGAALGMHSCSNIVERNKKQQKGTRSQHPSRTKKRHALSLSHRQAQMADWQDSEFRENKGVDERNTSNRGVAEGGVVGGSKNHREVLAQWKKTLRGTRHHVSQVGCDHRQHLRVLSQSGLKCGSAQQQTGHEAITHPLNRSLKDSKDTQMEGVDAAPAHSSDNHQQHRHHQQMTMEHNSDRDSRAGATSVVTKSQACDRI
jgi:hypothetical protein